MMEEEQAKRISTSNNNNTNSDSVVVVVVVDRMSDLPDCILSVILSYLPTYQAIATSLLSKRWKFSWLDVLNLHFNPSSHRGVVVPENMAFIRFVHRVLLLTGAKPLNKVSLGWDDGIMLSHVICWLDAAIIRKVRDLDIYYLYDDILFNLPISCFNCDSLRSLKVESISFVYDDTTHVCLPRLETLELEGVRFTSEKAFEKLINGCPMLRWLGLRVDKDFDNDDDGEDDFMYVVSSPSLKYICMYIGDRCRLMLKAPALECLHLYGCISEIVFVDKSLSSLVEAFFEMDGHPSHIPALDHVKFRTLATTGVTRALAPATACLSTEFKRLVKLQVSGNCRCFVQDFVNNSENLEELKIYQYNDAPHDVPHGHSRWTAPVVVPRCLSKGLKKVRLTGYNGLEDEREMIRFVLEHGIALENVEIRCENQGKDGEQLLKEICEFPKKSPACKVSTWVPDKFP